MEASKAVERGTRDAVKAAVPELRLTIGQSSTRDSHRALTLKDLTRAYLKSRR